MKALLVFLMLIPTLSYADTSIGVLQGWHMFSRGLNENHPYITYEDGDFGVTAFVNSFDKLSVAPHYILNTKVSNVKLIARIGATTGYDRFNFYKGRVYVVQGTLFLTKNLMLMIVPEIRYDIDKNPYINLVLMGESISLGLGTTF